MRALAFIYLIFAATGVGFHTKEELSGYYGNRNYRAIMYVLVDYDNLPGTLSVQGTQAIADRIQDRLVTSFPTYFSGVLRLNVRFYGGWHTQNGPTPRGSDILAQVQRNFPMVIRDGSANPRVVINASVAESLLILPQQILPHTFRTYPGIGRSVKGKSAQSLNCINSGCPADVISAFLSRGMCPNTGCSRTHDEMLSRTEQKLVDTMLVSDTIFLSNTGEKQIVVVSSDDDMWPGMLSAMKMGAMVFHVKTSSNTYRPLYLGSQTHSYRSLGF